ncbi:DNA invertase Pin-like site-specific DNA recombinase [Bradyrhizobium sp. R2.2-H]|jgi:DNA invertase Pin-like site-specific DNA recombinase|uniref:recombinase family protein n=1 Tax=unclassified Bradyrhizobium TaxID=2631580 RepID=UPI0010479ED0|nr:MULTISPECIES: recombinase family protein [unclassified Bradyrhizobium]TCU65569.1 DNA invertase Pin-like site-specific DNA recombinase [Bradyrhizobium sp. Y-H1]TCU67716.1 DNA invertase Pin-like site-specific DNA recombinase [Bradyrhizobium sp. R2.2-H]
MINALIPHKVSLPKAQRTLCAAQYVRMSTDHQRYSIENQAAAIATYAQARGLEIVRTYRDDGESGLGIRNRPGLTSLITDVRQGRVNFDHILIYDVSRWGRFQDIDESAHYEFICREAGMTVCYCAEQFENDGSVISGIIKNIKRVMAAEYSRELGVKVHTGACHLSRLGFRQGGHPSFGLRRELIDENGRSKGIMETGQWKSLQTDRVILRPGPQHEIEMVRLIFDFFVKRHLTETKIARELNLGDARNRGRPWTFAQIHYLLQNDNYIGTNRYNRHSARLRTVRKENPPADWIKKEDAFEPVVDKEIFAKAQQILEDRRHCWGVSDEEMLKRLRVLLHRRGRLSRDIINETEGIPSSVAYLTRFGSLRAAYRLIGYSPKRSYEYVESRTVRRDMVKALARKIAAWLAKSGEDVRLNQAHQILKIHAVAISFRVARSRLSHGATHPSWVIIRGRHLPPGLVVVVRLNEGNREIKDYLLMPASQLVGRELRFSERNQERFGLRRYGTAAGIMETIKRRLSNLAFLTKPTASDLDRSTETTQ